MNKMIAGALTLAGLTVTGCNQQVPGGPGVTEVPNSTSSTSTTAKRPMYGEAEKTFDINAPSLATRINQGESESATISLSRGKNFTEDVALSVTDLPTGVTVEPIAPTIKEGDKEIKIKFNAAEDAVVGECTVKLIGHPTTGADASSTMKLTILKK